MTAQDDELLARARGREDFLRNMGSVKTADILRDLVAALERRRGEALDAAKFRALTKALNEPGAAEEDAAVERNAERYGWLRIHLTDCGDTALLSETPAEFDAAVDAAMRAGGACQPVNSPHDSQETTAERSEGKKVARNSGRAAMREQPK